MSRRLLFLAALLMAIWMTAGADYPLPLPIPWPSCC